MEINFVVSYMTLLYIGTTCERFLDFIDDSMTRRKV